MTLNKIKLIIWDLDETLWLGTISEESVNPVESNIEFIKNTSDMGIVHSICSKNDFDNAKNKLEQLDIWEYFVFPSIDWNPKGTRIKNIISTMGLRPVNVLFIDDNIQNLKESEYFCEGIMTALPEDIEELKKEACESEHNDKEHKRLKQYHQMEEKEKERSDYTSNEEFLFSCNIKVDIRYNCEDELDRIHELIMRSNQLNFTKNRQEKDALLTLMKNKDVNCGYVKVSDRFGDYGIVGFFAIKDNKAIHFTFSCRTLGMQVEQYVYAVLNSPHIEIAGEVVAELSKDRIPKWINQTDACEYEESGSKLSNNYLKVLIKGPCDMEQMYAFLDSTNIYTEFTYLNDKGISVEGHNHTSQIVTALYSSEERKKEILSDAEFFDANMLDTCMTQEKFDYVVLSMLTDGNLGIYKRKEGGEEVSLCEKAYSLTDKENVSSYVAGKIFTSGICFTESLLNDFAKKYEYVSNEDGKITINNLQKIRDFLPAETVLILLLGSERQYCGASSPSYEGRHKYHIMLNKLIRDWAQDKSNVIVLSYDNYIKSNSDFIDTINHFTKKVYYELAKDLIKIFRANTENNIAVKGITYLILSTLKQRARVLKSKILKKGNKR